MPFFIFQSACAHAWQPARRRPRWPRLIDRCLRSCGVPEERDSLGTACRAASTAPESRAAKFCQQLLMQRQRTGSHDSLNVGGHAFTYAGISSSRAVSAEAAVRSRSSALRSRQRGDSCELEAVGPSISSRSAVSSESGNWRYPFGQGSPSQYRSSTMRMRFGKKRDLTRCSTGCCVQGAGEQLCEVDMVGALHDTVGDESYGYPDNQPKLRCVRCP